MTVNLSSADDSAAFPTEGFAKLARLEAGHFWFEGRNDLILWALGRYFPTAESFYEIGCGTGFVLTGIHARFPAMKLAGGELYEDGLDFARARLPGVELSQIDARNMQFEDAWRVVGAFDVLEHIKEDDQALAQMFKATKSGGGVLITVPQHMWLWSAVDEVSFHQRRYSRKMLVERVKAAGFKVERVTSFVSLLLPLMFLGRLRKRKGEVDTEAEFKMSPTLNRILRWVMRVEFFLIKFGINFPAGGSLLLVARKP